MMKPILLVSAIALAAPVLAQTTSSSTSMDNQTSSSTSTSTTTANDDTGAMSGNTVNAQNSTGTPDDADDATTDHSAMGHSATDTSAATTGTMGTSSGTMSGTASTQTTMSAAGQPMASAGQTVQPCNDNPERDARGIAVLSDPAFVPAGWNGTAGSAMGGPVETSDSYPACSATVTDNCTQTYERNRSR